MGFPKYLAGAGLLISMAACGGQEYGLPQADPAPAEELTAPATPDTASATVVDSSGAFFDDTTGVIKGAHEHGPDTHTH